ncbi:uncharacterized protein Dvir_GJ26649 [Drosophila virilis]|uniref:Uncharacterized protein n=1 Tax=Drosophila virilis TaxID=7244 RepID=A0A0Q9W3K2_DROVI|nr:uncharacterized protein LOC26531419 [Drosophila virilis]KRF79651.1 uncharacterized protein Dvir_GJ26649 [Drosophila virilis]
MEHREEEAATITSKTKVLAIGDGNEEYPKNKQLPAKDDVHFFREDFTKRLCLLLTGNPTPIHVVKDWDLVQRFGAASIKKDNQPRRYHFVCGRGNSYSTGEIISGPVFNAVDVLNIVKNRLKAENWISTNVIETPLKTKVSRAHDPFYGSDQYIQGIVSDALHAEDVKLFKFLLYLHRESIHK